MQDDFDGRLLLDEVAADRHAVCEVLDLCDRMRRNPRRRKIIVQLIRDAVLARALRQRQEHIALDMDIGGLTALIDDGVRDEAVPKLLTIKERV